MSTEINSSVRIVFDLSRSVELHKLSTAKTNETAVSGITNGLMKDGDTVTWRAKHLFKYRFFTSKITAFEEPAYFKDEMQKGDFKKFIHKHFFKEKNGGMIMTDEVELEAPYGFIGKLAVFLFLKNYIKKFLLDRNALIKEFAEAGKWKLLINDD